ncbi:MAG TPA: hypothetical protein VMP08_00905 [Anaerolineae bacterium]|nr:hypothetical protein [Anaerolineae bacterium]
MPGQNKSVPAPFIMQVLTTEYFIEGTAAANTPLIFPIPEAEREMWNPIVLTAARIKVVGHANLPERSVPTIEVGGNGVVAVIPRTDVTQMVNYSNWKIWNQPRSGVYHVGPYLIQGKFMSRGNSIEPALPMVDVHIMHMLPESGLSEFTAPFILVNTNWLSGYLPA